MIILEYIIVSCHLIPGFLLLARCHGATSDFVPLTSQMHRKRMILALCAEWSIKTTLSVLYTCCQETSHTHTHPHFADVFFSLRGLVVVAVAQLASLSRCRRVWKFAKQPVAIDLVAELYSQGSRMWVQSIPSIPASHEGAACVAKKCRRESGLQVRAQYVKHLALKVLKHFEAIMLQSMCYITRNTRRWIVLYRKMWMRVYCMWYVLYMYI